jgi:hypothetical protein
MEKLPVKKQVEISEQAADIKHPPWKKGKLNKKG